MDSATPVHHPGPHTVRRLTTAFGVLVACTFIGTNVVGPSQIKHHPELVLLLTARMRWLILSVPADVSPWAYALIGFARLAVAGAICYALGRAVGERLFNWFDAQSGGERPLTVRWAEAAIHKFGVALVVVFPGSNIVAFLAGRRGMRPPAFAAALSAGIAVRLTWIWFTAKQFETQLDEALDFVDRYQLWIIIALVLVSVIPSMRKTYASEKAKQDAAAAAVDEPLD
jgi:membrane protein DedA with SNARE-associated domain